MIPHRVTLLDPAFEITNEDGDWDIETKNLKSNYFKFLINTSHIHWRKELEDPYLTDPNSEGAIKYRSENHFNIAGPNLTDDQAYEQKLHLINKIYIGGKKFIVKSISLKVTPDGFDPEYTTTLYSMI